MRLTSTIFEASVGGNWEDCSIFTLGIGARDLALPSNQVVKIDIRNVATIPITPTKIKPKMPAAALPREEFTPTDRRLDVDEPLLLSKILSVTPEKVKRFPRLLISSGQSTHCQPPNGPVKAGRKK